MRLKSIKIKNFLSWGNTPVYINFENFEGLKLLISGDNKQGKSTIGDAISFALFGKTIRPINKDDYINYINKRDMLVELTIETITKEDMIISRSQSTPSQGIEAVWKLVGQDTPLDSLSSKKLTQEKMCNDFYGFNYDEFKSSVALTTFNSNIMELGIDKKRTFFENIFKITEISNIKDIISQQYTVAKTNKTNLEANLKSSESVKEVIEENIKNIKNIKNNIEKDGLEQIEIYKKENKDYNKKVIPLSNKYTEVRETIKTLTEDYDKVSKRETKIKYNLNILKQTKEYIVNNNGSKCTHCGNEITEAHSKEMVTKIDSKESEFKTKLETLNIAEKKAKIVEHKKTSKEYKTEILDLQNKVEHNEKLIDVTEKNIKKQLKDLNIETQEKKLSDIATKIKDIKTTLKTINKEVTEYEIILNEVLHDDGLRQFILSHYIEYINSMLAENVKKLNLDFELVMTDSLNIEIQKLGMNLNYWGLSLGERSLLNTILLFVIVKLRKLTNTNFIDLILIDEFIDNGLSPESIELALSLIEELFEDTSIIMVSHKLGDQYDYFDNILKIFKSGSFSQIEVVK